MSTQDPYQPHPGSGWSPATPEPARQAAPAPFTQPGPPAYVSPAYGPPADGQPAYGPPAYGPPAYGQPAYGPPAYDQPAYGQPAPAYAAGTGVPTYGTHPAFGGPVYGAPAYGAPAYGNPGYAGFGLVTYASWGQRVGAYLLDSLAILPYLAGLLYMTATSQPGFDRYGDPIDVATPTGLLVGAVSGLVSLTLWGWNRWVHAGRTGQSWGKKALGQTLQGDATGAPIGVGMAFLRDLAHYVDGILYIGYLMPLWDGKRQTLSDKIVTSVVVR